MRVALMQPYLFPYIGYFQLIAACDLFVVRDEVQYIRGGWINRNRILVDALAQWLTLPVAAADHHLPINCRTYILDDKVLRRIRRRLEAAYRAAPCFATTMDLIDEVFSCRDANVAGFNVHALQRVAAYLGIDTPIRLGSTLPPSQRRGSQRVIEMCQQVGAATYVNAIGGIHLYDASEFSVAGIALRFIASATPPYVQLTSPFVRDLSIIDALMFNERHAVSDMLKAYHLLTAAEAHSGVEPS